jgi:chromosome segregation protein
MFLKRLELQGYKTFASRTEFEFESGITAIVGPNGSGKSNVADALRWVLGEHKYSALRAKRSDDMIFAGGQGRSRVGMAEVSLTFDNSTGWLPIDYAEVTIQRRTFRSGENQYFINDSRVRRRDIIELLAQGGVSSNTYTIIAQGAVDASLNMRPEERRAIFEEAAGIAIHQAKRDQALRKLDDTRNNLLRVNDIIKEIAPRLKRLSKQAERAREYQEASKKLEAVLETWYGYRWRKVQDESNAAQLEQTRREEELAAHKRSLEEISLAIDRSRKEQAELRGQLGAWHTESGELHRRLEELQRELAVKQEGHRLIGQRRQEIQQELSPLGASRDARQQRIRELEQDLEHLAAERRQRDSEWAAADDELTGLQRQQRQLETELSEGREAAFQIATELADLRNRRTQFRERRREIDKQRTEHEETSQQLVDQLQEFADQIEALGAERDQISRDLHSVLEEQKEKEQAAQESSDRQTELAGRLETVRQELSRLNIRQEVLVKAQSELADYSQAVRTLLSERDQLSGIVATVAEVIDVPSELERAVGAALGNLLQAVVIETWQEAERALYLVQQRDAGRVSLVPVDDLRSAHPDNVPRGTGVVGLAANLVGIREGLDAVLVSLLGSTLVVEDLAVARKLHQERSDFQIVTLGGEVVSTTGALTGGSEASGSVLLAHQRERRDLPQQIAALEKDSDTLEAEVHGEENRQQALLTQIASLKEKHDQLEQASRNKADEIGSWEVRRERAAQELEWHEVTAQRLQDEIQSLQEKEHELEQQIETTSQKERETAEAVQSAEERLEALDLGPLREKVAGLKTAIAVLERSQESQDATLAGHRTALEQIESQIEDKERRVAELCAEADELEASIATLTEQTEELRVLVEELSTRIAEAERQSTEHEHEQQRLEKSEAAGRRKLEEYESAHNEAVLKRQRCEDELRNLQERIEADLETVSLSGEWPKQLPLDIDARLKSLPVVTEVPRGLEADIKHLRRRLRQLGPVDLETVDEYKEVSERHEFLVGQVEDLEKAAVSLRKVATELNRLMEDKFVETFARIADEFRSFFPRLFNGGQASLELTDPENPLQSGVEIVAQPPGRRRRSIAMLSGGERALTGVALTFSVLKTCATPFCLLDEVDARLDEVNVGRFGQSLEELAEKTQIVVITHNRGTVEAANSIYGVTMGGDGASRVLSLRLEQVDTKVS